MAEAERIVINTGPVISLARAEALDVIASLPFSFVCPLEVQREIQAGAQAGHPEISLNWLTVTKLRRPLSSTAVAALDEGEAAVIQLASEQGITTVCLDDKKGRRVALGAGLQVVGALGLLLRAKSLGRIPAIRTYIDRLMRAGAWYDADLLRRVLDAAKE